jgi:hypothetical protein
MNLVQYLTINIISIILSWLAWFFLLFYANPFTASLFLLVLFYLSLFIAVASTFSFTGLVVRVFILKRKMIPLETIVSFRQGLLFSILIIVCLFLSSQNLFKWWLLLILIFLLLAIEFFFISTRRT